MSGTPGGGSSSIRIKDQFITKDSGQRVEFDSGMRRDTDAGKPRYDLIPTMPLRRLADLYARGAEKYGDENWTLADSKEEMRRFRASAFRHFEQWRDGELDEDHAIAVVWNVFAYLYVEAKLAEQQQDDPELARLLAEEAEIERAHADALRRDSLRQGTIGRNAREILSRREAERVDL